MSKIKNYYLNDEYQDWNDNQYDAFIDSIEYDLYIEALSKGELK